MLNASAEMWLSHGSWYCIHSMDDHTVRMKNDKQMEGRLEVVSSPGRTQSRCLLVQMKALQGNSVPQIHLSPRPPAGLSLLSAETTSQVCEE